MPEIEPRITRSVVLVRLFTGAVFVIMGWGKLASVQLARPLFFDFLYQARDGGAANWYVGFLPNALGSHPGKLAVFVGFLELMIGIGLLLGLAVRPVCALGVLYMLNLMLATWHQPGVEEPLWRAFEFQARHLFPLLVFLLLGVAHAGEHWGLGALYHRRRIRRQQRLWDQEQEAVPSEQPQQIEEPAPEEHSASLTR